MVMTYLEAAERVLRDAGTSLHYRDIARAAIEKNYIEPKGKTPHATMGAQLYTAVRRSSNGELDIPFRAVGRGIFALADVRYGGSLDYAVQNSNERVRKELKEFIAEMPPRQFEFLIGRLLAEIGFVDIEVTQYSGDQGIDVTATLSVGGVTKVKTAIQAKRWSSNVPGKIVRELRGGASSRSTRFNYHNV